MGIKQDLRRVAGVALVVAGAIAAPGAAQAQVSVGVDAGDVAQVSTSSSSTGLAVGEDMRAGTGSSATALEVAGVGANVAQNDLRANAGSLAGVGMDDDLTVQVASATVVLDDKLVGARTGVADVGADVRRGATTGVKLRPGLAMNPTRRAAGRTMLRTCRSLSRRQARGLRLTTRQLRTLAGCRR